MQSISTRVMLCSVKKRNCMKNHIAGLQAAVKVLRKRQLCQLLGISTATLDRLRVKGEFPAPIRLGEQAVGWTMESVQGWLASRPLAHHFITAISI
jgi:prophage regulatory protein